MMRRRDSAARLFALALVACSERQVTPGPEPAPSAPALAPEPAPEPPSQRACGEAGAEPTELPPLLAGGQTRLGRATLRPGDRLDIGATALHYQASAWIGTMKAGFHGPVLDLRIDRAEVGPHDPWGTDVELHAGQVTHRNVGPYRFDVRVGAGSPPAEVEVSVERDGCPAGATIAAATDPRWLWLSTEGIRQHTYDFPDALLQLILDTHAGQPRLDVATLSYRQFFEPRPGPVRRVRAGRHLVTLDRVVPGPATQFTDRWQGAGEPRLHVRAAIEPLAPATFPEPVAATSECGDLGPARTTVPPALTRPLAVADAVRIKPGDPVRKLGPLTLTYVMREVPAYGSGPYRVEATWVPDLQIVADPRTVRTATGPYFQPRLLRITDQLLHIESVSGDTLAVSRIPLPCPHLHRSAAPTVASYMWLSSVGHAWLELGDPRALLLQVYEEPKEPSLSLSADGSHMTRPTRPDLVGLGFTLDDYLVEIADLVTTPGGPVPAVHVQVRVTPNL